MMQTQSDSGLNVLNQSIYLSKQYFHIKRIIMANWQFLTNCLFNQTNANRKQKENLTYIMLRSGYKR